MELNLVQGEEDNMHQEHRKAKPQGHEHGAAEEDRIRASSKCHGQKLQHAQYSPGRTQQYQAKARQRTNADCSISREPHLRHHCPEDLTQVAVLRHYLPSLYCANRVFSESLVDGGEGVHHEAGRCDEAQGEQEVNPKPDHQCDAAGELTQQDCKQQFHNGQSPTYPRQLEGRSHHPDNRRQLVCIPAGPEGLLEHATLPLRDNSRINECLRQVFALLKAELRDDINQLLWLYKPRALYLHLLGYRLELLRWHLTKFRLLDDPDEVLHHVLGHQGGLVCIGVLVGVAGLGIRIEFMEPAWCRAAAAAAWCRRGVRPHFWAGGLDYSAPELLALRHGLLVPPPARGEELLELRSVSLLEEVGRAQSCPEGLGTSRRRQVAEPGQSVEHKCLLRLQRDVIQSTCHSKDG
mmetsp:Transcript_1042/g.2259  ORF Transcript_1042/g.2259 Transcript_1042/m.2259 type:complete len:407 (-) Transcript_1042:61-1281(-)